MNDLVREINERVERTSHRIVLELDSCLDSLTWADTLASNIEHYRPLFFGTKSEYTDDLRIQLTAITEKTKKLMDKLEGN